jgi:hypothetical protein
MVDRFRKDIGKIEEAYQEVLKRVWIGRVGRIGSP